MKIEPETVFGPRCEFCGDDVPAYELDAHGGRCAACFERAAVESERWQLALDLERLDHAQLARVGRLVDRLLGRVSRPGKPTGDE